jgi:hypothetical protein
MNCYRTLIIITLCGISGHLGYGYEFLIFPEERNGYMGAVGCQTSMCHGGAGPMSKQFTIWKQVDPHSKSYATLTTAWSRRMAETLNIEDPAQHPDCTSCHAPMAQVAPKRLASPALIKEGVSCGSCHGPSSEWIQSHTRPDYTHQQRVAAGMTDQENLYIRANTCVACHQQISPAILEAGHPKLEYDLVALQNRQPRHWQETFSDSQAWLVGQATSLRETAHVLHLWEKQNSPPLQSERSQAQIKLLTLLSSSLSLQTKTAAFSSTAGSRDWKAVSATADELAYELSRLTWTPEMQDTSIRSLKKASTSEQKHLTALVESFEQVILN